MANLKNKKNVVADKTIDVVEAIELLKKACQEKQRKFVENVDLAINLTIDPKQSTQNIRGSVSLPAGSGKAFLKAYRYSLPSHRSHPYC